MEALPSAVRSQDGHMWLLEGAGFESAGIKCSNLLEPLHHCLYPDQYSIICLLFPSTNMNRVKAWTVATGCDRQRGIWKEGTSQAIKLGRENHGVGSTEEH